MTMSCILKLWTCHSKSEIIYRLERLKKQPTVYLLLSGACPGGGGPRDLGPPPPRN